MRSYFLQNNKLDKSNLKVPNLYRGIFWGILEKEILIMSYNKYFFFELKGCIFPCLLHQNGSLLIFRDVISLHVGLN